MQLLTFDPLLKRALWGGRRLGTHLGKTLGEGTDYAESWEVADLPGDVTMVTRGSLNGCSLRQLVQDHPRELLGAQRDQTRFPLLIKYLDASQKLSIQVHPSKAMSARRPEVTTGKAETWVILHADPGSRVYAGLKPGVDRQQLREVASSPHIVDCLHSYEVQAGDCISLLPGTVHAIGEGLVLAEVQEPNNVTYRLSDWGRVDAQGKPRELHLDLALDATNFDFGPVDKVSPVHISNGVEELVRHAHFTLRRFQGTGERNLEIGDRPQVLMVLRGSAVVSSSDDECRLSTGQSLVIPAASRQPVLSSDAQSIVLQAWVET